MGFCTQKLEWSFQKRSFSCSPTIRSELQSSTIHVVHSPDLKRKSACLICFESLWAGSWRWYEERMF